MNHELALNQRAISIRNRWRNAGHVAPKVRNSSNVLSGGYVGSIGGNGSGVSTYSGADVTNTTGDFLGDWRAADSWMRFDIWRVRNRSRQLERGNPWCQSFITSFLNNVIGAKGFRRKVNVVRSPIYGDKTDGDPDEYANQIITATLADMSSAQNFTTRKRLSERDADRLLLARWFFDGEVILRKIKNFPGNDYKFAWQIVDPDYLDQNLNRIEENGNITKMGVELEKDYKYPVAYWFLHRRPNDFFYNYTDLNQQRYIRVPADEVIHIYQQTLDPEQTRGFPMIFAAAVNLFRLGKYEEAALVNATIGASKMGFFKKTTPDGFEGSPDELDDDGCIIDTVSPGSWTELPWNVEPVDWTPTYPEAQFGEFSKSMLRSISAVFGCSYATLTNDLSEANFVSSKIGQNEEQEAYMAAQEFFIEKWKRPDSEERLYRAIISGKLKLPLSKFDKFNKFEFRGRRWKYLQPIQDIQAKQMLLDNCLTTLSDVFEETNQEDFEEMLKRAKRDTELLDKYGLARVHSTYQLVDYDENGNPTQPGFQNVDKK
jgi:lambda family phage portal protein